jgi:dipeptidyl aminopeptidase/acylaminoacyl peptidase
MAARGELGGESELSDAGYFILCPNPRGSAGEGEAFERANVKDFGYGDLRDILAGVDKVVQRLPVDKNRVGIFGWSYGEYMAMWAVTQTPKFHAAVAGAGIADWFSYAGEADIPQWTIPYFGASVYDDPFIYARSSPMNYIKNVKTPTLIQVGSGDGECPAPQSLEFWHALRTLGVKTELVIYPDEGHGITKPEHTRDIMRRRIAWFNEYLK